MVRGRAAADLDSFGLPESEITTVVDVSGVLEVKRAAMHAHATQIGDFGPFLAMPDEQLRAVFGQEWFRRRGAPDGLAESSLPL
jgi:LmbE family N-acetylglucosaminyl deacetylase